MTTNDMTAAFEKAGLTKAGKELWTACAKFFNHGGTIDEFDKVVAMSRSKLTESGDHLVHETRSPSAAALGQLPSSRPDGQSIVEPQRESAADAGKPESAGGDQATVDAQSRRVPAAQTPSQAPGPMSTETRRPDAGTPAEPGDGDHLRREAQVSLASVPRTQPSDRTGPTTREAHLARAGSTGNPGGGSQDRGEAHTTIASVPRRKASVPQKPVTPAQRAIARKAGHTSVSTIFDRELVSGMGPVGDIYSDQLRSIVQRDVRSASFALRLLKFGHPTQPTKLREYLSTTDIEKAWKESAKIEVKEVLNEGLLLEPDGNLSLIRRVG